MCYPIYIEKIAKGGIIMLKFQNDYSTVLETFEDFILTVYVIIDDLYKQFVPPEVEERHNISRAKLSDSEVIAISICGELAGIDSENAWYSFIKRNYHHLFPNICSRSRFNRVRRALLKTSELLRQKLAYTFQFLNSRYFIVDSFPLPVCKFGRARYCRTFRGYDADYGKCPSKKETYFGYKVHALVTFEGYISSFEITSASTDDREGLRDLVYDQSDLVILGDKGYSGINLEQELANQGICLMALKPSNSKTNWLKPIRQMIFKQRRRIETVFSQLTEQLNAEKVLAKSFHGLCTRIQNKILAYNLCLAINDVFNIDCKITEIKKLIF